MQRYAREPIPTHGVDLIGQRPDFIGAVELGESFVVETENSNEVNGPICIAGVAAGDDIAVQIEDIAMIPPIVAPNGGPSVWL